LAATNFVFIAKDLVQKLIFRVVFVSASSSIYYWCSVAIL